MFRSVCCLFVLGLLALSGGAADDDTITLKDHQPKVGDRERITEEDRTTSRTLIVREDKRDDKQEKKHKIVVYVAETLAVKEGEKRPVRVKRTYERAEETTDGATEKLPLHGKTVIIEKKGDKYAFTDENGRKLPEAIEEALAKEFKKKDDDSFDKLIPKRPLKRGETWKIDPDEVLKDMVKDKFVADRKRVTATGTLARVYKFGGHRYGGFDIKIDVPITEMIDETNLKLKPGSAMSLHVAAEVNVEGTEPDGFATMRMSMLILFEAQGGVDASIRVEALMLLHSEALPPRKRD